MLIPNPDLDFWNFDTKINFWANLGQKIQSSPFCLKIGAHSISRMLIPNPDLDFWNSDPKIYFWANLGQKIQSCSLCLNISRMLIPNSDLDFWNSDPKIFSWANLGPKSQSCLFCLKIGAHGISRMLILIATLVSRDNLCTNFQANEQLWLFWPNLPKNRFRVGNSEN